MSEDVRTRQNIFEAPPRDAEKMLCLSIVCVDCKARRNFQITTLHDGIRMRKHTGLSIETECAHCGRKFEIAFAWVARESGWTTQSVPASNRIPMRVEDGEAMHL